MITKQRTFPTTKAVKGNRHGDCNIDTDHAHLYAAGEFARNFTIAGEYRLTPETVSTRLWVMLLVCKLKHFAHPTLAASKKLNNLLFWQRINQHRITLLITKYRVAATGHRNVLHAVYGVGNWWRVYTKL